MERQGPPDESRGIEKTVLSLYAFYTVLICIATVFIGINKFNIIIVVAAWIAGLGLYIMGYGNFKIRAVITSVLMQIAITLYAIGLDNVDKAIPLLMVSIVVVQIYGIPENMFTMYVSALIIFGYHASISHTISLSSAGDIIHTIFTVVNVLVMISVSFMLLKKRQNSTSSITKIISELKTAQRSKDLFLANVSHEIRTPINSICGLSEMAMREDNQDKLKGEIYSIQTAGRNLMSIVSDILDFSELNKGNVTLEEEDYNITSTINDIINTVIARKMDRPIELIVDCNSNLPSVLRGDEKKIRRVIMNVVNNALKFTNDGCIAIDFSFQKQGDGINLIINVRDTGIGISEDTIEKLFDGFWQVDEAANRQNTGLGLGLTISNILVRKMGGVITAKSNEGQGTSMSITLPQAVVDETPIIRVNYPEKVNAAIYLNMEKFNLMQIRDEYDKLIRHIIGNLNIKSYISRNLLELKQRIRHEEFTHIFLSYGEYCEDRRFFDEISKKIVVVVFAEQSELSAVYNEHIHAILKPFYVLPICEVLNGHASTGNVESRIHNMRFIAPDAKILVVDDNIMNLNVIEGLLQQYQIQVTHASSGMEALEKIGSMDYDFVFMDHMMPQMDGVETVRRIRERSEDYYHNVPIIALTANAIAGAREYFLERGFTDFLEKPIELSVLERVLKRNIPPQKQIQLDDAGGIEPENEKEQEEIDAANELGFLDTASGISFCGNREMYYDILKSCYEDSGQDIDNINANFEAENWTDYVILVHALKGTMKTIGAKELSEKARKLEYAGKENDIEYIRKNNDAVMKDYRELMDRLASVKALGIASKSSEVQNADSLKDISEEQFKTALQEFEEAVYNFDENKMLGIIQDLEKCRYRTTPLALKLSVVRGKVEKADYMSAHRCMEEMFDKINKN